MVARRGVHFCVKKRVSHTCVTEKKVKFDGTLQKLCRKWCCMLLWDFRLVCSTGILYGQFPFLLMYVKYAQNTPAVKFRKKLLCERLYNIADNLCAIFYHDTIYGCTENFLFAWKIWLCVTACHLFRYWVYCHHLCFNQNVDTYIRCLWVQAP